MQRGRLRGAVAVATRAVAIVVVALLALPGAPGSLNVALAGDEFCANDPILSFDGQIVRIIAFVPRSALPLITEQNPIRYRVYVPQNVRAEVLGYTGEAPERVDFVQTGEIASGSSFTLRFEMIAPDRGAGTTYRGYYIASSTIDYEAGGFTSGQWVTETLRVPYNGRGGTGRASGPTSVLLPATR